MSSPRKRLIGVAATVAITLALAACSGGGGSTPSPSPTGGTTATVTIATRNIAASLDPATMSDDPSFSYVSAVYETLLDYDPTTKKFTPALATSWSAGNGGTSYTFKLRKGVTFHDGGSLTAAGVKDAIERTIQVGKGYAYLLSGVSNITATDDTTLTIKLKSADAAFLSKLTMIFIASDKAIKAHPDAAGAQWFASNDAGSGPYELETFTPNSELVVSHYKGYWRGWGGSHVATYDFKVTDAATQVLQLKQGTADIADAVATTDLAGLKSAGFTVQQNAGLPFYIAMNLDSANLTNKKVRRAIALAIPYQQIISKVLLGYASRLAGPAPDWAEGVDSSIKPTKTDVDTAKSLMAAEGYDSAHPLQLSLIYFNGLPLEETVATIVQSSLKEIGVDLSVTGAPWATLTAKVENKATRPDLGEVAMSVPTPDIGPLLTGSFDPASEGSWQYWGYNDPATVDLLHQAAAATNASEQARLYAKVQQNLVDQDAAVWLMQYPDVIVTDPGMQNVKQRPSERAFDYYAAFKK
jgi:peptide/nickel transport system substrate-binding protein